MAAKGIVIQITGDGAQAAQALNMVDEHLKNTASIAKESSAGFISSMRGMQESITLMRDAFVLERVYTAITGMIDRSVDLGMELGHLSQQTGISAENLSVLRYASQQTGIDFDTLTRGFKKLSTSIFEWQHGEKTAAEAFKELGISAKDVAANGNDMWKMLALVADKFKTMPNGIEKNAVATQLFGRAGQQLIPILNQGSSAIENFKGKAEKLGAVMTDQDVQAMEELNASLATMKTQVDVGTVGFTEELAPALEGVVSGFTDATKGTDLWREAGKQAALAVIPLAGAIVALGENLRETTDEWINLSSAVNAADSEIGAHFNWTKKLRDESQATHDAAMKSLHDSKVDHDAAEADEKSFIDKMLVLKRQVEGQSTSFAPLKPGSSNMVPPGLDMTGAAGRGKGAKGLGPAADNSIAEAQAALAEAHATAMADAQKNTDALALLVLDAQHKQLLVSDADFYDEQQALQQHSLDAEMDAQRKHLADLQAMQAQQHADKTLKRDKSGQSVEELRTAREIVQVNQQINALQEKRDAIDVNSNAAAQERADAAYLQMLKDAATMEENINGGITARLALMQREHEMAMQKATTEGGDTKALAALQAQEVEMLKIGDIQRQIDQAKEEGARKADALRNREQNDPMARKAVTSQLNALNIQTAATLQQLVVQYDALAKTLGGEFIEKAKALHAEMAQMQTPNQKYEEQPYSKLSDGMESMAQKMASATNSGRQGFHRMTMSMEQDITALAAKFAIEKWLGPLFTNLAGGGASGGAGATSSPSLPGFAAGGDVSGLSVVGEKGPELFFPKGPGTIMPNDALQNLSKTSAGGGAPNVTMNFTNNSSQPLSARQSGVSYDSQMKSFVIQTVLEDHASGGPIAQSLAGLGSS